MPRRLTLDPTDWKILKHLQESGRMTNVELANRVGLSPPPCLRRVQALEEAGIIKAYRAVLDPAKLGFEVMLFALVGLKSQAESELDAFEARARQWPQVRECHAISGEADFILKCIAADLPAMQDFVIKQLTAQPNVEHVKTMLILREYKYEPGVPIA
jgi:DNA-binding Lrp family transcriptional regulator